MKSPFPGMDPFLENEWPEVHASLIVYARNQLPDDLNAKIEKNLSVLAEDDEDHSFRPDVTVVEEQGESSWTQPAAVTVAEPLLVRAAPRPDRHIEIVSSSGRVITAIEFLSPSNKTSSYERERYFRKQQEFLQSGANLVEVDLIRQGSYVLVAPLHEIPEEARAGYKSCVYRQLVPDRYEIYRSPLRERLPNIPIPLRPNEPDVVLQLQPLIDAVYKDGRYYRWSYANDPHPSFDAEDAAWVDALLREHGKRT